MSAYVARRNVYYTISCRKKSANLVHVAKSGDEDITTTHCEAYELTKLGHEEDLSEYQNSEYEVPDTQFSAHVPTKKSGE